MTMNSQNPVGKWFGKKGFIQVTICPEGEGGPRHLTRRTTLKKAFVDASKAFSRYQNEAFSTPRPQKSA